MNTTLPAVSADKAENLDGFIDPADLNAHVAELLALGTVPAPYIDYARRKARAMDCRLMGLIEEARTHEQACDGHYTRIPKAWKW